MNRLSNTAITQIDEFWAAATGCTLADLRNAGTAVVELPTADGSEYVQLFRRGPRVQITCSTSLIQMVHDTLRGHTVEAIFDKTFLSRALGDRIERVVGPAYLGYLDTIDMPIDEHLKMLTGNSGADLDDLRHSVSVQDWKYSGLGPAQPISGYFVDGCLVGAAGYKVWGTRLAHIGVVTRPEYRDKRCGRACVAAIAAEAIGLGLIAQYRTLYANAAAMAVARALGFVDYGATIYVAATAK